MADRVVTGFSLIFYSMPTFLLGGAVLVEQVFGLPGLGKETVQAITTQDLPVIMATAILAAAAVVVANLSAAYATATGAAISSGIDYRAAALVAPTDRLPDNWRLARRDIVAR